MQLPQSGRYVLTFCWPVFRDGIVRQSADEKHGYANSLTHVFLGDCLSISGCISRGQVPSLALTRRFMQKAGIVCALAGVVFAAPALLGADSVSAQTRTLKLYNTHTKERAEITFKRNGRYVSDGLKKMNQFLRDWRRNEATKMDPKLFDLLWEVHRETRSREPIHVVSGFRSAVTNNALRKRSRGVAKNSQHTRGRATDFFIPGVKTSKLRQIALKKQVGGVGYYPTSNTPFVHLDTGSVRAWPRLSRKQLVALFPDGKTLHLPSNGKPLKGYASAEKLERAGRLEKLSSGGDVAVASTRRRRTTVNDPASGRDGGNGGGLFAILRGRNKEATPAPAAPTQVASRNTQRQPEIAVRETAPAPPALPAPVAIPLPTARPASAPVLAAADPAIAVGEPAPASIDDGAFAVAIMLPIRRPGDVPGDIASNGLLLASNAAEAPATAYASASTSDDPLADFLRGGQPLSTLGAEQAGGARQGLIRRAALPAQMVAPSTDMPPSLTSQISIARAGDSRFFRHPDQSRLHEGLSAPRYLVINSFGLMASGPAVGAFEGRAIAPVAFRRLPQLNLQAASLNGNLAVLR